MYACKFTITTYGTSGNELPPPPISSFSRVVLSGAGDARNSFQDWMSAEGIAIRQLLDARFAAHPDPYSQAESCSWSFDEVGSITDIVKYLGKPKA